MIRKIGILGSGQVAQVLGSGFLKHQYDVFLGTREPSKLAAWKNDNPKARVGSFEEAAKFGEAVVLAVKGDVALSLVKQLASLLNGKIVMDTTNPIAPAKPNNGVLNYFTTLSDSLMERLQSAVPVAHFVKVFNSVGNLRMVNPEFADGKPTMFICGNQEESKKFVSTVLDQFGWETEDMGKVEAARAIEPLCMLWCIPGFMHNQWTHAFKLLRK